MATTTRTNGSPARTRKGPPPPLTLPVTSTTNFEEKPNPTVYQERPKSHVSCSSFPSNECLHKETLLILPTVQRPKIIEALRNCGSSISKSMYIDGKQKKHVAVTPYHLAILRERQSLPTGTVDDSTWMNFIGAIVKKSFDTDFQNLLDKYKTNYFDRVNAPNTSEQRIRSFICQMASTSLATYSSVSTSPESLTSETSFSDQTDNTTNNPTVNQISQKRKRKFSSTTEPTNSSASITSETRFVLSSVSPRSIEMNHTNKSTVQQQSVLKKVNHLTKYIPNENAINYLMHKGHLKNWNSLSASSNHENICLMLYDEILKTINESDLDYCGINTKEYFTLPSYILVDIRPAHQ